jgi:NADPH:quinone reductase-like Zn-dependent oxidoreductase
MRVVVLTEYGDVDKLELRDVPDLKPGPGEVKIKTAATSVNPIDWKLRSGAAKQMMSLQFPAVLGRDVSGEVMEAGPGVTAFKRGDRVLGLTQHAYAEQVLAKADAVARLPDGLDLRDAAALPLVALTGTELIDEAVQPKRGDLVLVTGAVGNVGRSAVFAAKRAGARVIAGVRRSQKRDAEQLGVEQVVAIDDDGEIARLPEVDAIADTIGGETIARLLPKIRKGGTLASVVGEPAAAKGRDLRVRAFVSHPDGKRLGDLAQAAARGELRIPISNRLPISEIREAHRLAERGAEGKILLTL